MGKIENKLEKYKRTKFHLNPDQASGFTKQEAEYIYAEAIRRVEWEMGEKWLNDINDKEITEIIVKKTEELARIYFKRQAEDKFVDKFVELLKKKIKN